MKRSWMIWAFVACVVACNKAPSIDEIPRSLVVLPDGDLFALDDIVPIPSDGAGLVDVTTLSLAFPIDDDPDAVEAELSDDDGAALEESLSPTTYGLALAGAKTKKAPAPTKAKATYKAKKATGTVKKSDVSGAGTVTTKGKKTLKVVHAKAGGKHVVHVTAANAKKAKAGNQAAQNPGAEASANATSLTSDMYFQNTFPGDSNCPAVTCMDCGPTSTWTHWQRNATDPGSYACLVGSWTRVAAGVSSMTVGNRTLIVGMPGSSQPGMQQAMDSRDFYATGECEPGIYNWPQDIIFQTPIVSLNQYRKSLDVNFKFQVNGVVNYGCTPSNPSQQAASYTVVAHLSAAPGSGQTGNLWVSLLVYDSRDAHPTGTPMKDQTGIYIYPVNQLTVSPGIDWQDTQPHAVSFNVLPQLDAAVTACWKAGACSSGNIGFFNLDMINAGWETTGRFGVHSTLFYLYATGS